MKCVSLFINCQSLYKIFQKNKLQQNFFKYGQNIIGTNYQKKYSQAASDI